MSSLEVLRQRSEISHEKEVILSKVGRASHEARHLISSANGMKREESEKALAVLQRAEEISPHNPVIFGIRAQCYTYLRDLENAEKAIKKGLALSWQEDNKIYAMGILTQILLAAQKIEEAEMVARENVALLENSVALHLLAKVLMVKRDFVGAEKMSRASVSYASAGESKNKALTLLAEILRKQRNYQASLIVSRKLPSGDWRRHIIAAFCHLHLGKLDKSLAAFILTKETIELVRGNYSFADSRIRLYAGVVFLYEEHLKRERQGGIDTLDQSSIEGLVRDAEKFLLLVEDESITTFQRRDFDNALLVLEKLSL